MTYRLLVAGLALLVAFISPNADAEALDEIIVRADLRASSLVDLPASISVLDAQTIERQSLSHFEELSHSIANLNFAGGSNRPRYFQIRGVGERSQYEGAPNPSVGFIVDGIDLSAIGGVALTWDLDQVEVLKGPQGTRHGANAIAGLINLTTRRPSAAPEARVRLMAGEDDARALGVAASGALGDSSFARLSAYQFESNGFRDNPFLGRDDTNGRDEAEIRARWVTTFNEVTELDISAFYVDMDNGYDAFALDNGFTTLSDRPGRDSQRTRALAARLTHTLPNGLELRSITSAAQSDITFSFDADWGNEASWAPFTYDFISERQRLRENQTQEFRLIAPLTDEGYSWLAGVYVSRLREDLASIDAGLYVDPAFGPFDVDTRIRSDYDALSTAAFAQVDLVLAQNYDVSVGLRAEHRSAEYYDSNGIDVDPSETMWGGHARVSRQFSQPLSGYVQIARGYKAGGFNLGQVPSGRRTFDAESVVSTEIGMIWRSTDYDRTLRAALFYDRRSDQQISTSAQINPNDPSSFVFFVDNAASGTAMGLELEAKFAIGEDLTWSLNLGTLATDVELDDGQGVLDGRDQAHAPPYTFATFLDYDPGNGFFGHLGLTGKDRFYFSDSHDERSSAYQLVSARLGYRQGDWTLTLWGRNLTDERYAVRGFFFGNEPPSFPDTQYIRLGDRRQIGLTLDWGFE